MTFEFLLTLWAACFVLILLGYLAGTFRTRQRIHEAERRARREIEYLFRARAQQAEREAKPIRPIDQP